MKVPASARWSAYALAAVLTLAAAIWVGDDDAALVVQPSTRSSEPRSTGGRQAVEPAAPGLALLAARNAQGATADPFAVLDPVPEETIAAGAGARAQALAPPAASAPPLPFVYLGRWKEQGRTSVFVQRDDRSYKIDGPGPLDSEYAVRSIGDDRISLTYLPLGTVQELRLDAPAVARAAGPAPIAQASAEPDPGEN
jgi:hypothetical protein